jgi:hypothetical protein
VGAKRVMIATQGEGEGLGSGFCSSFFWSFEKEKRGEEKKKGEEEEIEGVKWEGSEVGHLFL